MPYLVDTNVFIEAKNDFYGMDFCPAFWDWLVEGNRDKRVFSIDRVRDELIEGGDQLSEWAKDRGSNFFIPSNDRFIGEIKKANRNCC